MEDTNSISKDDVSATLSPRNSTNASFVGAKTVNGPAPDNVSANPACTTKSTRVVKMELPTARSTMLLLTQEGMRTLSIA